MTRQTRISFRLLALLLASLASCSKEAPEEVEKTRDQLEKSHGGTGGSRLPSPPPISRGLAAASARGGASELIHAPALKMAVADGVSGWPGVVCRDGGGAMSGES